MADAALHSAVSGRPFAWATPPPRMRPEAGGRSPPAGDEVQRHHVDGEGNQDVTHPDLPLSRPAAHPPGERQSNPLPLAIIPTFLSDAADLSLLLATIASLHATAPRELVVLVVDDRSPGEDLVDLVELERRDLGIQLVRKPLNEGFSATVNVGLRRALEEGRDAILVNADVQLVAPGWVRLMREQPRLMGDGLASVVGALLLYPNGLIQHGGIYFSLLTRQFDHLFKYGPGDLPEANVPSLRPVTGALQFIRHECLMDVGVYDEAFRMGYEDVDYCVRTMLSGRECVYQPAVRALHLESVFRGRPSEKLIRWHRESLLRLWVKYQDQSFAGLVPAL